MKNNREKIEIRTAPNGYTLTVGDEQYMYFNADALLEGFLVHVGIGISKSLTDKDVSGICATVKSHDRQDGPLLTILQHNYTDLQESMKLKEQTIKDLQREKDELRHMLLDIGNQLPAASKIIGGRVRGEPHNKGKRKNKDAEDAPDSPQIVAPVASKPIGVSISPSRKFKGGKLKIIEPTDKGIAALGLQLTCGCTHMTNRLLSKLIVAGGRSNRYVRDVAGLTEAELMSARGFGDAAIREFSAWMRAHDLDVGIDVAYYIMRHQEIEREKNE